MYIYCVSGKRKEGNRWLSDGGGGGPESKQLFRTQRSRNGLENGYYHNTRQWSAVATVRVCRLDGVVGQMPEKILHIINGLEIFTKDFPWSRLIQIGGWANFVTLYCVCYDVTIFYYYHATMCFDVILYYPCVVYCGVMYTISPVCHGVTRHGVIQLPYVVALYVMAPYIFYLWRKLLIINKSAFQ